MLAGKRSRAVRWKRQQNAVASKPRFISNDRSVDSLDASICAEIRTKIPDTIAWDYNFEPAGANPLTFTVKSAALKEAIEDLEWPGSSIQIILEPELPSVTLRK
ncbi:hypothetical protein GLYMA_10G145666v4 [Glycine max]|nr:hypothetical protein GLYMA_10G145666v4 [Glycine max]KAH1138237.1 hypothetical protein GYH30_028004 [Glycine max]|eukprot:XP_025979892.1 uncharacterized protein LOC112998145 isoform X1 [Glycine max]